MPEYNIDLYIALICIGTIIYLYIRRLRKHNISSLPLPPGPKKLPLLGNLLQLPSSKEWETYAHWGQELRSDIIHLDVAGTSIVVLNSQEAAWDLLEKRSSKYSSRPRFVMANELMGWDFNFGFQSYAGDHWRAHRRMFHQIFHPAAAAKFQPQELQATHELLRHILDSPDEFLTHLRHHAGSIVMSIAYGIDVLPKNDPYIELAEAAVHALVIAIVPGTFMVDTLPLLRYIPSWFPGASFKGKAKEWKKLAVDMVHRPYNAAKQQLMKSGFHPSFVSYALQNIDDTADLSYQEEVIRNSAASMYAAGADTSVSAIGTFILGILSHPEIQRKAQEELDRVIKPGHLPDFDDEPSLPYITAIVKETLRWKNVVPIAIPHFLEVEDEYKGYRLPAGSIIIPNGWAMMHDEAVYSDPLEFKPERFINAEGKIDFTKERDPGFAAFGFGRRICPGRYMAYHSVWISIASILAAFNISKAIDPESGKQIEPSYEYFTALVCMPLPFKCSIKPRSKDAEDTIRALTRFISEEVA